MRRVMEDCDVDADVDVRDPDEKSIMTYVAQFLQYSKDLPLAEDDVQVCCVELHALILLPDKCGFAPSFYFPGEHLQLLILQ